MLTVSTHIHLNAKPEIQVRPQQNSFCALVLGGGIERANVSIYFDSEADVEALISVLKSHIAERRKLAAVAKQEAA